MPGDYCDVYLTHDSMSVRKAHNSGRNHLRNVVDYYQRTTPFPPRTPEPLQGSPATTRPANIAPPPSPEIGHEKAQSVIDSITSSYAAEGQAHANPMLPQNQPGHGFPPFPFPGGAPPPFAAGGVPPPFPGGAIRMSHPPSPLCLISSSPLQPAGTSWMGAPGTNTPQLPPQARTSPPSPPSP